jgi:hypothetical protein
MQPLPLGEPLRPFPGQRFRLSADNMGILLEKRRLGDLRDRMSLVMSYSSNQIPVAKAGFGAKKTVVPGQFRAEKELLFVSAGYLAPGGPVARRRTVSWRQHVDPPPQYGRLLVGAY